jgi:hypothetical protein
LPCFCFNDEFSSVSVEVLLSGNFLGSSLLIDYAGDFFQIVSGDVAISTFTDVCHHRGFPDRIDIGCSAANYPPCNSEGILMGGQRGVGRHSVGCCGL